MKDSKVTTKQSLSEQAHECSEQTKFFFIKELFCEVGF